MNLNKPGILLFLAMLLSLVSLATADSVRIEEAIYQDRSHYVVYTPSATYWYDQAGGGLSRILDKEGKDWIGFRKNPLSEYPASAAAGFRGMPNFVFQSEDGGAGHPGFDQCRSEVLNGHRIRTRSLSGKWQWTWAFYDTYARVTMEKVDPDHAYWFLYEGIPGGEFAPETYCWGTDTEGYQIEHPDYFAGERAVGNWQWAYFGNRSVPRVLLIGMVHRDAHSDLLGVLGNTENGLDSPDGMVVFGFGREKGATPLMTATNNTFLISFIEQAANNKPDHRAISTEAHRLLGEP